MAKFPTRISNLLKTKKSSASMDSSDVEDEVSPSASASIPSPSPPSALSIFHEDILLDILSYVADVPFETDDRSRAPIDSFSTLTHTLPLVSKQFHRLTHSHDLYWKHALLRLVDKEPSLWGEGLKRAIFDAKCDELRTEILERNRSRSVRRRGKRTKDGQLTEQKPPQAAFESKICASQSSESGDNNNSPSDTTAPPLTNDEELLEQACSAIEAHPPHHHTATTSGIYQCLYQSVVLRHLRYQAPVFYMNSSVQLGSQYGLHMFEPRYRLLMSEVMSSFPLRARRGERIGPMVPGLFPPSCVHGQRVMEDDIKASTLNLLEENESLLGKYQMPTFIHAHQSPLRRNTPATIVQVQHCAISPDGSADVLLKPIAYIWLEQIWERPGTGGLIEARGIRMGKEAMNAYESWCSMSGCGRGDGRGRGQMLPMP